MSENNFQKVINSIIPSTGSIIYNESQNVLLTSGYTSLGGNTYFKGIRLSKSIMIVVDIGIGHTHTFLNGINIYSTIGEKKVVTSKHYSVHYYNEANIKEQCISIISDKILATANDSGYELNIIDVEQYAKCLVEEAYNSNQIEVIKQTVMNNLLTGGKI